MSVDVRTSRNVDEVLRRVKRTFGDEAGVQINDADIMDWINDGQIEIARETKYDRRKIATDSIEGVGFLPIGDLNLLSIESVAYKGKPLDFVPLAEAEETIYKQDPYFFDENGTTPIQSIIEGSAKVRGTPKLWVLDMSPREHAVRQSPEDSPKLENRLRTGSPAIYMWPVPDTNAKGAITLSVVLGPRGVQDSGDSLSVPDKYFNALIQFVLAQAYELDEDHTVAQIKRQEYAEGLAGLDTEEREEQQRLYPTMTYFDEGW